MRLSERHNRVKQVGYAPGLRRPHFAINTSRLFHYGNQLILLDQPTKLSKKSRKKSFKIEFQK